MDGKNWFRDQRWGVFTHFLYHEQNAPDTVSNMGVGVTDWNDCVDGFDVERLAAQLQKAGAHYLIFTLMQGKRFLCAPNATFDSITGYHPVKASRFLLYEEACCSPSIRADGGCCHLKSLPQHLAKRYPMQNAVVEQLFKKIADQVKRTA